MNTYYLGKKVTVLLGAPGDDDFIATADTLIPGDVIRGGSPGTNTLTLQGPGAFNLNAFFQIVNVQFLAVQEGAGQTVYLRNGLDLEVDAASPDPSNPGGGITIWGARNVDTIKLGNGNDTVYLGDARESVVGGGGNDQIWVTGATIGATIDGGSGSTTLHVTGGGTATIGNNITDVARVVLEDAAAGQSQPDYVFTANAIQGLAITASSGNDTITLGGTGQSVTVGVGKETLIGAAAGGDTFKGTAAGLSGDMIQNFAAAGDAIDATDVAFGAATHVGYAGTSTGGTLTVTDGTHTAQINLTGAFVSAGFHLAADGGNGTSVTYSAPQTMPPPAPVFDLAAGDQTGAPSQHQTQSGRVTLVGQTGPGDTVTLLSTGETTVASNTGAFQLTNVALALGANPLTVQASDAAGQTSSYSLTVQRQPATGGPDPVIQWNQITLKAIALDADPPTVASRSLAMESLAVFDAVSAIDGTPGYLINVKAPADASPNAAVAAAADEILDNLYPAQAASFDAQLATSLAAIPDGQAKTDGVAFGKAVADRIIALRAHDGSTNNITDTGGSGVGVWQPTPPAYMTALDPQWARLEPFAVNSPDQFLPPPPPDPKSAGYAAAVNQVQSLGSATSTTRTADQTQIAKFWNDQAGTYTPPGHWNAIADAIAQQQGDGLAADARLFAELNVAEADAAIAAWNSKFTYNAWRPVTAIRNADSIGNPGVTQDPSWISLITTPNFPEYVAGHPTYSGAAAQILDSFFGSNFAFSFTDPSEGSLPGVTRNFTDFNQAAQEAGQSRVYGGIHFQFSVDAGLTLGTSVGDWTLKAFDLSQDTVPPKIVFDQTSGLTTNKDPTITGDVTDNLSGVASLTLSLDGGTPTNVSFNSDGTFSIPVALPVDGSADGQHKLSLVATDAAGNVSSPKTFSFQLETQPPRITLASGGVQDGGTLSAGEHLTGTAAVETGDTLAALSYAFDGGTAMPVGFNATSGTFDQVLELTHLAAGNHTLAIKAVDAAGNTATDTLHVSLSQLPPLTITGVTPMAGAADIGVTYRPKVTFSRPVDPSTLTGDSFFATDTTGAKLAATILPTADNTGAYLLFTNPLPGASTITLHVQGEKIKGTDGTSLDAAGTGTPGSDLTETYATVSTSPVSNTTISGIVVDPGPDNTPMTPDDVTAGPNGLTDYAHDTWKLPIAGVKVYVLGHEDQAIFTDGQGHFTLTNVPTGDVKVVFDGTTATNDPAGFYFPLMTMDATIRPGIANTMMGSMGTLDQQAAQAADPAVYLPRVATNILTPISNTQPTTVMAPANSDTGAGNFGLTSQQLGQLSLTIQPGSVVDANGKPVQNPQVGISPVPPQLVMEMLPPGLLQHTFDITIQAPGGAVLTQPATLTMPNVFGLAPGEKTFMLSFDHTTGRLVIDGTATVSADGQTVNSDPGSGVTAPGWHGMTTPGPCGSGTPGNPIVLPTVNDVLPLLSGDTPRPDDLNKFSIAPPPAGYQKQVTVTVDSQLQTVLDNLASPFSNFVPITGGNFNLSNGDQPLLFDWQGKSDDVLQASNLLNDFSVYGGVVTVKEVMQQIPPNQWQGPPPPPPTVSSHQFFIYRYLNPVWAAQRDFVAQNLPLVGPAAIDSNVLPFPDAVPAHSVQFQKLDLNNISSAAAVTASVGTGSAFSVTPLPGSAKLEFNPSQPILYDTDKLQFSLKNGSGVVQLNLKGTGQPVQTVYLNEQGLIDMLGNVPPGLLTPDEQTALSTATGRAIVADVILSQVINYYKNAVGSDIDLELGDGTGGPPGTIVTYSTDSPRSAPPNFVLGTAQPPDGTGIDNAGDILHVIDVANSIGDTAGSYDLSQAIDESRSGKATVYVFSAFRALAGLHLSSPLQTFENLEAANVIGHEVGHTLGLVHLSNGNVDPNYRPPTDPSPVPADIMSAADVTRQYDFTISKPGLQLASDESVTAQLADLALRYYHDSYIDQGFPPEDAGAGGGSTSNAGPPLLINGKALSITESDTGSVTSDVAFGDRIVTDGKAVENFVLQNIGSDPVSPTSTTVNGSSDFSLLLPTDFYSTFAPGETRQFGIEYSPHLGSAAGIFVLKSDALPVYVSLSGRGLGAGPTAEIDTSEDDFGGMLIGGNTTNVNAVVINNLGAAPLVISSIDVVNGKGIFTLPGLPDLSSQPLTIAAGGSYTLPVAFQPSQPGLEQGTIEIKSNDPAQSDIRVNVVGTGTSPGSTGSWGNDFVAISFPSLRDAATIRLKSDPAGDFNAFLPASTQYKISVFDPKSGLIADGEGITAASGLTTELTNALTFQPSTATATGLDGLPDDIAFAIGADPHKVDNFVPGISDLTAIKEGLTSSPSLAATTGVVASLALQGEAQAVILAGSLTNNGKQTAYIATGSYGLAIVDASNFQAPTILGQLRLFGNATDVTVDTTLGLAAVATGTGGLAIINVTDPTKPSLVQTIAVNATQVRVVDGIAYANDGGTLDAFDLATGLELQTLNLGSSPITGVAVDGTTLYTMDASNTLRVIDLSSGAMVTDGSVVLQHGGGRIFVANGVAYVPTNDVFSGGYSTVDVSNPSAPKIIATPGNAGIESGAIALNGSGLGIAVGKDSGGPLGVVAVDVVDTSDSTNTGRFLTRYTLPAQPQDLTSEPFDVAIGSGIAFVAEGTAGLQVVNYRSFDTAGIPPAVQITQLPKDIDPNAPGIQVMEGQTVTFGATITDDVQVRNVEVLVNGVVVSNSVSFPWDLSAKLPSIAANGSDQVTLQVEAIDTGGNATTSAPIQLQLVRDTTPPRLISENISNGSVLGPAFRAVVLDFSKSLDESTVTAGSFALVGPGGTSVAPQSIQFRNDDKGVQLTYARLASGQYQFDIAASKVTDRSGNPLGSMVLTTNFTISPFTAIWSNAGGGNWSVPSNWTSGQVPGSTDAVLINLRPGATVLFDSGTVFVASISIKGGGTLAVSGGVLTVSGQIDVASGVLQLNNGGTIHEATISNSGGMVVLSGGTLDGVTYQGTLDLSATIASVIVTNGITFTGAGGSGSGLVNLTGSQSSLYSQGTETLDNATINIGNTASLYNDDRNAASVLTLGSNLTVNHTGRNASVTDLTNRGGSGIVNLGTINAGLNGGNFTLGAPTAGDSFTNQGNILVSSGDTVNITANNFTNSLSGRVSVASGGTLSINATSWSNAGTITVNGATANLGGTFTLAASGSITNTGGTLNLTGTLDNTGSMLNVGTGSPLGILQLTTGTIKNGTIRDTGSGIAFAGGTLDGVTYQGTLDLSAPGSSVVVKDGIALTGVAGSGAGLVNLTSPGSSFASFNSLYAQGSETLDNATINIGNNTGSSDLINDNRNGAAVLTLGSRLTLNHTGSNAGLESLLNQSGSGIINVGDVNAGFNGGQFGVSGPSFNNQGTIAVTNADTVDITSTSFINSLSGKVIVASGGTLLLNSTNWSNAGTISVNAATLRLGGSFTRAQLGTLTNNGVVDIDGTLDDTNATLNIGGGSALGTLTLTIPGTIKSGTIHDAGSGLLPNGGTLDGVTYQGTLDLSADRASVVVKDGITLTGIGGSGTGLVNLTGAFSDLRIQGSGTLDNATVDIGNSQIASLESNGTLGSHLTINQTGSEVELTTVSGIANAGAIDAGSMAATSPLRGQATPTRAASRSRTAIISLSNQPPSRTRRAGRSV
jgi:hypothetical protein